MEKREQLEILSRELLGKLAEVKPTSKLFFPFDYKVSEEIEKKYFPEGAELRTFTISCMVLIDNSFKKFQVFPDHDIMVTYVETQRSLLDDWRMDALKKYKKSLKSEDKKPAENHENDSNEAENTPDDKADAEEQSSETPKTPEDIEKELKEFDKVLNVIVKDINEASKPAIKRVGTSEEAQLLNNQFGSEHSQGGFINFIQNKINDLFN